MNVLFVSSGNSQFGIAPFIKSQGDSLIKAGVDLKYFLIQDKGFVGYLRSIFKLKCRLKKDQADLIHAHYGLCGWVAYLAKPKKIPLVLSYMGSDILPVIKGKIAKNAPVARFCRALQNHADYIVVKSENLKNILKRKTCVSIVPNGIDLDYFKPLAKDDCRRMLGLGIDRKIVLFLGNPEDDRKNFQLVENAFNLLNKIDLILIAPYPTEPDQVPLYLNAADVLIVSSISEGSPNVVKEAMATNCPIVSTDIGDVRWVIGDTPGCFLASRFPEDMALKIKSALEFNDKTTGRSRMIELGLDGDAIAKKIITIYETTLKYLK